MADEQETIYYCRKCGAKLSLNAATVSKHYEKSHFSDWVSNKDLIARMPKAFLTTSRMATDHATAMRLQESALDPTAQQHREENKAQILTRMAKCVDKMHYKEGTPFECPCCQRTMNQGMIVICNRERFVLCYECYNIAKEGIPHRTRKVSRI